MARAKTSKNREFSLSDIKPIKIRSGIKLQQHDARAAFRDPEAVYQGLIEALKDGDADAFKEILAAYLEIANKDEFARKSGIPRRTLFRMLTPEGNPTLDNIVKVVSTLKRAA